MVKNTRTHRIILAAIALLMLVLAVYTASIITQGIERSDEILADLPAHPELSGASGLLPAPWIDDLLQVEDPHFWRHNGIDLSTPGAGLTTITQALVKLHYVESFRPGLAKYRQTVLALVVERQLSKDQILGLFLHSAYLGHVDGRAITGFPDAARVYFGRSLRELSHDEYLSLVAMLIGPNKFKVTADPSANLGRTVRIKNLLAGRCEPAGLSDVYYEACG